MAQTTSVARFKWYHAALIALVVVVLACAGFSVALSTSPAAQQAVRELGAEWIKVNEVRQKVADKFGVNVADVGVEINVSTFSTNRNETKETRTLAIKLVNTTFNDIPTVQRKATLAKVAAFARDNYAGASPVDQYCVTLVTQKTILIFTSGSNYSVCFSQDEL
jgi:hypothetical protein